MNLEGLSSNYREPVHNDHLEQLWLSHQSLRCLGTVQENREATDKSYRILDEPCPCHIYPCVVPTKWPSQLYQHQEHLHCGNEPAVITEDPSHLPQPSSSNRVPTGCQSPSPLALAALSPIFLNFDTMAIVCGR